MKLGFVTTSYPADASDYAGSFVATRVGEQARQGHEITIVAAGTDTGVHNVFRIESALFSGEGAPERLANTGRLRAGLLSLGFTMQQAAAVRARLAGCDAIESHWLTPSSLAVSLAFAGVPRQQRPSHHAVAHSGDVSLLENLPMGGSLLRTILAQVDTLQVVSDSLARRVAVLCGEGFVLPRLQVAPMEPSPHFFGVRAEPTGSDFVLGVGRLVPIKGFDDLLFAVGRMPGGQRPRVVLLGDGPEGERLLWLARRLSVELELRGRVAPSEVSRQLAKTAALVVPSRTLSDGRREGAPVVIREAQAMGVPLLVSASAAEGLVPAPSITIFGERNRHALCAALHAAMGPARATGVAPASRPAHHDTAA